MIAPPARTSQRSPLSKGDESAGSDDAMFREGQLLAVVGEQVDMEEDVEMTEAIAEERMGWKRTEDGLLLVPEEHQAAIL